MKISLEQLKQIKTKQIVYPALSLIFIIAVGVIFWKTISFISTAVNDSFALDTQAVEQGKLKIDLVTYYKVARKLNIPTPTPVPAGEEIPEIQPDTEVSPSPAPSSSAVPTPVLRSDISISILNSTKTSGLANELKAKFSQAGFSVTKTGNQASLEPLTLIKVGPEVSEQMFNEIRTLVTEKYPGAVRRTLEASVDLDIEIVIGTQ